MRRHVYNAARYKDQYWLSKLAIYVNELTQIQKATKCNQKLFNLTRTILKEDTSKHPTYWSHQTIVFALDKSINDHKLQLNK